MKQSYLSVIKLTKYPIMKFFLSTFFSVLIASSIHAQTLSPSVVASGGGYASNATGSLSSTIGEPVNTTLTSGSIMLTQGFQQSYKMTLNLKAYIEGYYVSGGMMKNVLYNEGVTNNPGNECDSITIQLRQATSPYAVISESKQILNTNGTVTFSGTASADMAYYIVIKSRNAVETWSKDPVMLTGNITYDFSTGTNKAYGDNLISVEPGVYALYSGDLNGDENVDLIDMSYLESDINNFAFGYYATDINGDGNVDLLDSPHLETNINNFVFSLHP